MELASEQTKDSLVRSIVVWSMPVAAAIVLIAFGILGIGRAGGFGDGMNDNMMFLYLAGKVWGMGASPYDYDGFIEQGKSLLGLDFVTFAYAPQCAPLAFILALFTPMGAKVLMTLLNLVSVGALVWLSARMAKDEMGNASASEYRLAVAVIATVIIGNPFTAHIMWMGQTSLLSGAIGLASFYAIYRKQELIGGVLLGLSTFKPPMVIFLVLWLLLDKKIRALAIGALTAIVCAIWPMLATSVTETWVGWFQSLYSYGGDGVTHAEFRHTFGVASVLAVLGIKARGVAVVGAILVYLLYRWRGQLGLWMMPGMLFALSALFVYAHDYDLAAATILAAPFIWATRDRLETRIILLGLAFVLFFPQRIWRHFDLTELARSRELALMLAISLVVALRMKRTSASAPRPMSEQPG